MGKDDLFKKRKARKAKDLARRKARRKPYEKVLIVCEGGKTEPAYFDELRVHYGLGSANVEVTGECGSSPISVVNHAKEKFRSEKQSGDPFDKVFCVFDKDSHESYGRALDKIQRATPKNTYYSINSVPCFEYWLLLHFQYTARPYERLPEKSACDQVTAALEKHIPGYWHGRTGLFSTLLPKLDQAMEHAARALEQAEQADTDNPSTRVHILVDFLRNIKSSS